MVGIRVAAKYGTEEFLPGDGLQRSFAGQPSGVGCGNSSASRQQPSNSIAGIRDYAVAMVGRGDLPERERRLADGHVTINSRHYENRG